MNLGEICSFLNGGTPDRTVARYFEGDVPWITGADINGPLVTEARSFITDEAIRDSATNLVPAGTILLVTRTSVGKVAIAGTSLCFSQDITAITPDPERVDAGYLVHLLRTKQPYFERLARGATIKGVTREVVADIRVPIVPLPEQRRIAGILDKADALRAKRRAALVQLDALHQSIFLDMFGDAATNPKGWEVSRIDDITECLDRLRRPITESDRKLGDVPYYGANGQQGWIDKTLFDEPLILVAEDGGYFDEPERGVAYRIDGPAWVNNHAHILRAIPARVDTEFLHRALRHFNFLPFISGTTRAKLTQGQLNAVQLFVPPLELQREFGARVERLRRAVDLAARAAGQLDALFSTLQHQAFRGDLARDASSTAPA